MICELCDICSMSDINRKLMVDESQIFPGYANYLHEHHHLNEEDVDIWTDYDLNHRLIHMKVSTGLECWYEYDTDGYLSKYKDNTGIVKLYKNGDLVLFTTKKGLELNYMYDDNGILIRIISPTKSINVSNYTQSELAEFQYKLQSSQCCISPYCLKQETCCYA